MIQAMIFDLDGTLVQTERLKALSYARAAIELCPYSLEESQVIEAFKEVVGRSRREVATALVERFDLAEKARARMPALGVNRPWQAYVQVRLRHYEEMLADPATLRNNQWPHNVSLLRAARAADCQVALATMSHCEQVQRVLAILDWVGVFDFVATRDDVERGKPDPEIYRLVSAELDISPAECLVIEDSPSGVKAALAAGMQVVAVATPFTHDQLHASNLLPVDRLVTDTDRVAATVQRIIEQELGA